MRGPLHFAAGALVAMAVGCVSTVTQPPPPPTHYQPQPAPAAPTQPPVSAEALAMREKGDAAMAIRAAATARLYYEQAAHGGDSLSALRLGMTYDPGFLWRTQLNHSVNADPDLAAFWYRLARDMGDSRAAGPLQGLERLAGPLPAPAAKPAPTRPAPPPLRGRLPPRPPNQPSRQRRAPRRPRRRPNLRVL